MESAATHDFRQFHCSQKMTQPLIVSDSPRLTKIDQAAFKGLTQLTSVNFTRVGKVDLSNGMFQHHSALKKLTIVARYVLSDVINLIYRSKKLLIVESEVVVHCALASVSSLVVLRESCLKMGVDLILVDFSIYVHETYLFLHNTHLCYLSQKFWELNVTSEHFRCDLAHLG